LAKFCLAKPLADSVLSQQRFRGPHLKLPNVTGGPLVRFFVSGTSMSDLIAKTAIDRRLADIVGR
jgi:hypothetical protein